jgi:hypothetical protein
MINRKRLDRIAGPEIVHLADFEMAVVFDQPSLARIALTEKRIAICFLSRWIKPGIDLHRRQIVSMIAILVVIVIIIVMPLVMAMFGHISSFPYISTQ